MALVSRDEAQELKRAYTTLFWCGEGCAQTQEQRVDGVMLRGSCGTRDRESEDFWGVLKITMQSPKGLKSDVVGLMGAATLGVVMLSPAMTLYGGFGFNFLFPPRAAPLCFCSVGQCAF